MMPHLRWCRRPDGKLLTVFVRNGSLWSRASTDGGATWGPRRRSPAAAATIPAWRALQTEPCGWHMIAMALSGIGPAPMAASPGRAERQLPTDSGRQFRPGDLPGGRRQAVGRVAVLLPLVRLRRHPVCDQRERRRHLVGCWSTLPARHTRSQTPAATVAADGRLVVVWIWDGELWQRSSTDDGATWSEESTHRLSGRAPDPALQRSVRSCGWCTNGMGISGIAPARIRGTPGRTRCGSRALSAVTMRRGRPHWRLAAPASSGSRTAAATRTSGSASPASGRTSTRRRMSPISSIGPRPNPDSDDIITFRAAAQDETGVAGVSLVWTLDGGAQGDLEMNDDGAHGDEAAGDGVWGVQLGPLPEGSRVTYRAIATDADGNSYRYPGLNSFEVLPRFVKTAGILFVPDAGGNNTPSDTGWFRPYYTDALEALGYRYDTWDTALRGKPGSAILNQYKSGAVIWAVPYWGYLTDYGSDSIGALQTYLGAGGKLFITGQNIAEGLYWTDFLEQLLCMRPSSRGIRGCMRWPARPAIPSATDWR